MSDTETPPPEAPADNLPPGAVYDPVDTDAYPENGDMFRSEEETKAAEGRE